jgi:hypothetical protein
MASRGSDKGGPGSKAKGRGRGKFAVAKKGGKKGKGRRGKSEPRKKSSQADLDKDLETWMLKDKKQGTKHLNDDLDDYFKNKPEKEEKKAAEAEEGKATEAATEK